MRLWILTSLLLAGSLGCADLLSPFGGSGADDDFKRDPSRSSGDQYVWPEVDPNNLRSDVPADFAGDDESLYVAADIKYEAEYSGDDAKFFFYLQRIRPAPETMMREMIQTDGDGHDKVNRLEKLCRCGQSAELLLFWQHKVYERSRGALHSPQYDQFPEIWGDVIVSHYANDPDWRSGSMAGVPGGPQTLFFGADTENPAAFFGTNRDGHGLFRTWCYAPNSAGGTKKHEFSARDDIRLAVTCDVSACPAELQSGTAIEVRHHFSHAESWIEPPVGTMPASGIQCTQS